MPDSAGNFYREVQSEFMGRKKRKYLFLAMTEEGDVRTLVAPVTVFKAIISLILEGYELWDREKGYGIVIARRGSGLDTSYGVLPSRGPQPIPLEVYNRRPLLEDEEAQYHMMQQRRREPPAIMGDEEEIDDEENDDDDEVF